MNIRLPPVEMDHSHTLTIHLTAISLSMLVSDMMPPKHLLLNVYAASGTHDFNTFEESHEAHLSQDIDTPPDDFYQVHQIKHSRKPPTPLSDLQKDHSRKSTLSAPKKPFKKYDGPVYVPAEVYKLLSPEAVVALKKYNSEDINKRAKRRGIHVTDITDHELSIAETNISEEPTNPHQDDDAPEGEVDPILDYVNSQHHQQEDMNHELQADNIMTSPFQTLHPSGQSTRYIPICFIMLLKQNKHNMVHLLIGEPMVDLQALM